MNRKGGVVSTTVIGVGALIIGVIVILVIVQTLVNADLFHESRLTTVYNDQVVGVVNETGVQFGNYSLSDTSCSVVTVTNDTDDVLIAAPNYTVTASTCTIAFAEGGDTNFNDTNWEINSSTTYDGLSESSVSEMGENFTVGLDKISSKLPTILLIVAVVFLLGALVLLMRNAKGMGVGAGGSL